MKLLLHTCCAPCSVYCVEQLLKDGIDITSYWYNPNIHPYKEYESRLDCLKKYNEKIEIPLIVDNYYGLIDFCKNVVDKLDNRCGYCYLCRLEKTAKYAKENGYDAFSTTLLISPYQNHELLKKTGELLERKYNIKFLYKDFRPGFIKGYEKARELGLYMQKYCGCIFSEEERYLKEIVKSYERDYELKLIKPSTMFKKQIIEYRNSFLNDNEMLVGSAGLEECDTYDKWINFDERYINKYGDNYVPLNEYIVVRKHDNKLIGMVSIRFKLNDLFLNYYGNIRYSVLKEERNKGYGNQILSLALLKCKMFNLRKVYVMCEKENTYAKRNILFNDGIFKSKIEYKSNIIEKYEIDIK